jgi:predicted YcjX-like family ATPase
LPDAADAKFSLRAADAVPPSFLTGDRQTALCGHKADHVTVDQHANMVSLLQQLVQDAWQNAAFEGIGMDCLGLASVQATQSGLIDLNGEKIPALRGNRLSDGEPLTVYPGEVPARLPGQAFWQNQGFQFEAFRPQAMSVDRPLPHIRLDAALEFLIGDKLR